MNVRTMPLSEVSRRLGGAALVGLSTAFALASTRGDHVPEMVRLIGAIGSVTLVVSFLARQPFMFPCWMVLWGAGILGTTIAYWTVIPSHLPVALTAVWSVQALLCGLSALMVRFVVNRMRRNAR